MDHSCNSCRSVHGWRKVVFHLYQLLVELKGLSYLVSYQDDSNQRGEPVEGPIHRVALSVCSQSCCGRNPTLHPPNFLPALHLQEREEVYCPTRLLANFQEGSGSLTTQVPMDRNPPILPPQLQGL